MQILRNQCFHYFSDFHLQEHPKRQLKSNILGQVRLKIPFEKRLKFLLDFLLDFWSIFDLGRGWGVIFATLGDFGGSRACPGGVYARCFRQGGPQGVPESDLGPFWLHFGWILGAFLELWA